MLYGLVRGFLEVEREPRIDGTIREETCSTHKHIEWDLNFLPMGNFHRNVSSTVFNVGNQSFTLCLRTSILIDQIEFLLVRKNPSVRCYIRCWAGFKRNDGSYDLHTFQIQKFDLRKKRAVWDSETLICYIPRSEFERDQMAPDGRLTLFFRIGVKRARSGIKICTHDVADFTPSSVGSIREEDCSDHKNVEWNISYSCLRHYVSSPAFMFGNQTYVLQLCCKEDCINTTLYRMGPSVVGSARWYAGLKLGDGTYCHRTRRGKLDLWKNCELWRQTVICNNIPRSDLERLYLAPDGYVTFFFRINAKLYLSGPETCNHYTSTLASGSIAEEENVLYRRVTWDVDYKSGYVTASPIFFICKQRCLFEMSPCGRNEVRLSLYRMGSAAGRSFLWWLGVNRCGGTSHQCGSECGELAEEAFELWTPKTLVFFNGKKGKMRLRVDFLMSLESDLSVHDAQALQEPKDFIVFKVKDEKFTMSKSILSVRVPVLEAMFLHDNLERRTGVMRIEDCEPATFQVFLNFANHGDSEEVTVNNAFALYVISDKYFFDQLKAECLQKIKSNLSSHTFFDTACLAVRYEEDALLSKASYFLFQNKGFMNSEVWKNFSSDNPDLACDVLPKLLQSLSSCSIDFDNVPKVKRKPKSKRLSRYARLSRIRRLTYLTLRNF